MAKVVNTFSDTYDKVGVYVGIDEYEDYVEVANDNLLISIFSDKLDSQEDLLVLLKKTHEKVDEIKNETSVKFMLGLKDRGDSNDKIEVGSNLLISRNSFNLLNTISKEYDVVVFTLFSEKYKQPGWDDYGIFEKNTQKESEMKVFKNRKFENKQVQEEVVDVDGKKTIVFVEGNETPKFTFHANHNSTIVAQIFSDKLVACDLILFEKDAIRQRLDHITFPYTIFIQAEQELERDGFKIVDCKMDTNILPLAEGQETILVDSGSFHVRIFTEDNFEEKMCRQNPFCHVSHIIDPVTANGFFLFALPPPWYVVMDIVIAAIPPVILGMYKRWQKSHQSIFSMNYSYTISLLDEPYVRNVGFFKLHRDEIMALGIGAAYLLGQIFYRWVIWN